MTDADEANAAPLVGLTVSVHASDEVDATRDSVERELMARELRELEQALLEPTVVVCSFKLTKQLGVHLNAANVILRIDEGGLAHQDGTLRIGDIVVAGAQWGRVRRLGVNGEPLYEAGPSSAVELIGLNGLPAAGDAFIVTADESKARQIAEVRQQLLREKRASSLFAARSSSAQSAFLTGASTGELPVRIVDLVVKSDVQGSAEALCSALEELEVADDLLRVKTRVLRSGAGAITSEDVMLASVSDALVLGFNSQAARPTMEQAEQNNVQIKEYAIVYDLIDEVKAIMSSYIRPPPAKHLGALVGTADVLQTFKIGAIGKVAGCRVLDGHVMAGCNIRILRGNQIEYVGRLNSLRSVKDEAERIDAGVECGMAFNEFQDMLPEDRVEAYAPNE